VSTPVGGGFKKVLYTASKLRGMGVGRGGRALRARNSCKACGLGMGGQLGGMTNELGEFPAVCNKSVQAQSTDLQPAIPRAVIDHGAAALAELDERELASLGRLDQPLYRAPGSDRFEVLDWTDALDLAAQRFGAVSAPRSFFYSSGRSSNEAGFVLQLLARLYGTNNVNNCSYYCHQATSVGLASTVGTGTATVELADLGGCDLFVLLGANPASNHPRLLHQLKALRDRGGEIIVINPAREPGLVRFAVPKSARSMLAGGTEIASLYLQPHIGSDVAVLMAVAKALLALGGEDRAFIDAHTEGFDGFEQSVEQTQWPTLEALTGLRRSDFEVVAQRYRRSRATVFAWGMGLTHHLHGSQNVEALANLALLRGMVGRRHAGLLPLRGHSNVQGIGTIGVKPVLAEEVLQRMEATLGVSMPRTPGVDTMAGLEAAERGEIDAALIMGGNLYSATPDSAFAARALGRIGFSLYLTTTLNRGHVCVDGSEQLILPVAARDEEWEPTTQESMFNFVRLSDGGIRRLANVRPESWILCELGRRLLPDVPFDWTEFCGHRALRQAIARVVPGLEALADIDVARREFHVGGRLLHEPCFATSSGRACFRVTTLPGPVPTDEFPFRLASVRSEGQFNTIVYEDEDVYRGTRHRHCVLMNPADAAALGLAAGDRITLSSAHGRLAGLTVAPFDVAPGNLLMFFPEANALIGNAVDPRSRTPAFKSVAVAVEPQLA